MSGTIWYSYIIFTIDIDNHLLPIYSTEYHEKSRVRLTRSCPLFASVGVEWSGRFGMGVGTRGLVDGDPGHSCVPRKRL
jgi:hypothetical protein